MIWQGWLFIGLVAIVATIVALRTTNDDMAIMFGLIGTLTWGLFAFQSLYIVTLSNGTEFTYQYPALTVWAIGMAITNVYVVIEGPLSIAQNQLRGVDEEVPR